MTFQITDCKTNTVDDMKMQFFRACEKIEAELDWRARVFHRTNGNPIQNREDFEVVLHKTIRPFLGGRYANRSKETYYIAVEMLNAFLRHGIHEDLEIEIVREED